MRSLFVIAMCLLVPGAALAQGYDPAESSEAKMQGFALSFGTGFGVPFGSLYKNLGESGTLSDGISGQIPLMVGAGFRANPLIAFGLAFTFAPALTKNCGSGNSCSASDTVIEAEFRLHFSTEQSFSQWISAEVGYEWLSLSANGTDVTFKGLQFGFQIGGDYRLSPQFTLGPFLGVRMGSYDSVDASSGGRSGSGDIPDDNQAWHGWFLVGLRGEFTM